MPAKFVYNEHKEQHKKRTRADEAKKIHNKF